MLWAYGQAVPFQFDPMADLSLDGYLTKKQAEKQCGRHRRTISSDITGALARSDQELLALCRVRTKDGVIRKGTDLTPKTLRAMVKEGDNPTWYCKPEFIDLVKQRKSDHRLDSEEEGATANGTTPINGKSRVATAPTNPSLPSLPKDPTERAAILEDLYLIAKKDLQEERDRNDKIFTWIETIPKQQEQTNVLLKNFQDLLERNPVLAAGNSEEKRGSVNVDDTPRKTKPVEVIDVDLDEPMKPSKKRPIKKKASNKKKSKKKTTTSFTKKHLPTISSWFGQ